jgi:hypothetical protein
MIMNGVEMYPEISLSGHTIRAGGLFEMLQKCRMFLRAEGLEEDEPGEFERKTRADVISDRVKKNRERDAIKRKARKARLKAERSRANKNPAEPKSDKRKDS